MVAQNTFIDATTATGLDFIHFNGMSGHYYFSEHMGPGVALFDYDNDGDLDIYLGQGHLLSTSAAPDQTQHDVLYRNDLKIDANGERHINFTDITKSSGLNATGYSMGVATGDIDNDGWIDLYICNFGSNQLWRNLGDGRFQNITETSNSNDTRWSTSAAFLDYDRDGWLDLYIVNYVDFRLSNHKTCYNELGAVEYCGPRSYRPLSDRLLRNLGGVRFEDVTASAGLTEPGPGLGVVTADFNNDGWLDIYIANDQAHNYLWLNQRNGRFRNEALMSGSAVNKDGQAEASMGVDAGDIDNDGDEDLFMTHLLNETNTLYLNNGQGVFVDATAASGLALPSIGYTGFGTTLLDYNNDGWLDLIAVNGEVRVIEEQQKAGETLPLRQANQLFHNVNGQFIDVSTQIPALQQADVSRGSAVGDIDNDGDSDVLISNNNSSAQLLINQIGSAKHWLGLRLLGESGRDMLGTRVMLTRADQTILWRRVRSDASYISANDARVLFGLGNSHDNSHDNSHVQVNIYWPDGSEEIWQDLAIDRYHTLYQGQSRMQK